MSGTLARRRRTDINVRSGPQVREYEAIAERIAAAHPDRVLDWGCGWGQVSHLLGGYGLEVTSFDYRPGVPDGIYPLDRFPAIQAHIVSSHPVKLPFADHSFSAVLSCGVLEHVEDPDASLDELRRVLRPGGTLYVYKLPNRRSYLEGIARKAGLYYHGADPHDRVYTLASAVALVERHGFRATEARYANMLPLTLSGSLAWRAAGGIWQANRALTRVRALKRFATNVELVASIPA